MIVNKKINQEVIKLTNLESMGLIFDSSGNFLRRHAYKGHLLMKKSNTQKRKLSQTICVSTSDSRSIKLMLPY